VVVANGREIDGGECFGRRRRRIVVNRRRRQYSGVAQAVQRSGLRAPGVRNRTGIGAVCIVRLAWALRAFPAGGAALKTQVQAGEMVVWCNVYRMLFAAPVAFEVSTLSLFCCWRSERWLVRVMDGAPRRWYAYPQLSLMSTLMNRACPT